MNRISFLRLAFFLDVLFIGVALVASGQFKVYEPIYHPDADKDPMIRELMAEGFLTDYPHYDKGISDEEMIVETTFTGIVLRDGRLFSTYDRTKPQGGKRACPT